MFELSNHSPVETAASIHPEPSTATLIPKKSPTSGDTPTKSQDAATASLHPVQQTPTADSLYGDVRDIRDQVLIDCWSL